MVFTRSGDGATLMLIQFVVENYLSFREPVEFSMVPGKVRSKSEHVIMGKGPDDLSALKTALIYGGNASGKSNLLKAMADAKSFILSGARSKSQIPFKPFKLNKASCMSPTKFAFTLKADSVNYEYGFAVNSTHVVNEWLNIVGKRTTKKIFSRTYSEKSKSYEFQLAGIKFDNQEDEQFFAFTQKGTPSDRLFLTECQERSIETNIPSAKPIIAVNSWFERTLNIIFPHSKFSGLEFALQQSQIADSVVTNILNKFDIGITGLILVDVDPKLAFAHVDDQDRVEINEKLDDEESVVFIQGGRSERYILTRKDGAIQAQKLSTTHNDIDGDAIEFDVKEESDGTRRLLEIMPGMLSVFALESVFVIDELDRSLHPSITRSILSSFLQETVGKQSQLIVTTHDASLLDQDLIRKDEVWFTDKSDHGESSVYSLEEYKGVRKDRDLVKGYLSGRFGGVNIVSQVAKIGIQIEEDDVAK